MRRTQLDTSVLKTENSVSNPSEIPFPDGLETELSVSNFDFSCSEGITFVSSGVMFVSRGVMFIWDLLFCLFKRIASNEKQEIFVLSKFTVFCSFPYKEQNYI